MKSAPLISDDLRQRMRAARSVFVLTGAGVSAESGVPTFRGGGGSMVWKGLPFDVISSAEMVERDLTAVWEWFDYRREVLESLQPNRAHLALAGWQEKFAQFTLATQNIDGLHRAAGSRDVLELHGDMWRARCLTCAVREDVRQFDARVERPPVCPSCGDFLRPDVVLFGELLPVEIFARAQERAARSEVCFVVGTSALVYPAAALPLAARQNGAYLVEINPEQTPLTSFCDEAIEGRAGEVLPLFEIE